MVWCLHTIGPSHQCGWVVTYLLPRAFNKGWAAIEMLPAMPRMPGLLWAEAEQPALCRSESNA